MERHQGSDNGHALSSRFVENEEYYKSGFMDTSMHNRFVDSKRHSSHADPFLDISTDLHVGGEIQCYPWLWYLSRAANFMRIQQHIHKDL